MWQASIISASHSGLNRNLNCFKGAVTRELRPRLLTIISKLFSRPILALHKIYILLKGQSAINKKPFSVR